MRCRIFVTLIFLFMFTIVQSLDFPYFLEPSDLFKTRSKKSASQEISSAIADDENSSKWRRQSSSIPRRLNAIHPNKPSPRLLKYDFLLRQWRLRKSGQ